MSSFPFRADWLCSGGCALCVVCSSSSLSSIASAAIVRRAEVADASERCRRCPLFLCACCRVSCVVCRVVCPWCTRREEAHKQASGWPPIVSLREWTTLERASSAFAAQCGAGTMRTRLPHRLAESLRGRARDEGEGTGTSTAGSTVQQEQSGRLAITTRSRRTQSATTWRGALSTQRAAHLGAHSTLSLLALLHRSLALSPA